MVYVYNFSGYKISYSKQAEKDLKKIDSLYAKKIEQKFKDIVKGLTNADIKKLQGQKHPILRLSVGDYRALFEVHEHTITILVIAVGHRKDVYEKM